MASATAALYHSEDDVKLTIGGIQYLLVASQKVWGQLPFK